MDAAEAIAIIILIIAILVLVYYYLHSNPKSLANVRKYVPTNADENIYNFLKGNDGESEGDIMTNGEEKEGVGKKIKVKLSDIDMSNFNTDAFSKKIDSFLSHKSDELIKEWSLATKDDLSTLESRFNETTGRVDALDEDFKKFKKSSLEFQKNTESKLSQIDKKIEELYKK